MNVDHLMNSAVQSCRPEDNLAEVAAILWHSDYGAVPVVDEENTLLGIITDRDICMSLSTNPRLAKDVKVEEVMSKEVHSCHARDNIHAAMELMKKHRVRRLPVIDEAGKLEGLLAMSDLILSAGPVGKKRTPRVTCADVVETLQGICRPHASPKSK